MEKNKFEDWTKKDLRYIWHPYTQMRDCEKNPPILIKKSDGIKLYDAAGNFYYDTISSWWCNAHGHNHSKIKKAIQKQVASLGHILFAGFTHKPAILLAEKLVSLAPRSLTKVFFSDNGSTAVEVALKMSFQYWQHSGETQKRKFVSLDMGYHGDTIGAMSINGESLFNKVFSPLFFSSFKIPTPYCYRCPMRKIKDTCNIECVAPLEHLLQKKHKEIAAVILEPMVLGSAGMLVYPADYLRMAGRLAKTFKVHLILDEVATGFGRTGKMFAAEWAEAEPDFMCLSKSITGGYLPLAATLTTEKVYAAFYAPYADKKTFYHGHTYTANPISCAAGLESLKVFEEEKVLKRIEKIIPFFYLKLEELRRVLFVGDVRYIGLIGALELVKDKKTKKEFAFNERIGFKVYKRGLSRNLILRPLGNVIYFFLPLCVTEKEIENIFTKVKSVLDF